MEIIRDFENLLFEKKDNLNSILEKAEINQKVPFLQIYAAIVIFFSFSQKYNARKMPTYIQRLSCLPLGEQEKLHYVALQSLVEPNLDKAFDTYLAILKQNPTDKVALLMLETCGFLTGHYERLAPIYEAIFIYYEGDPNFKGMWAFLLCHLNKEYEALYLIEKALKLDPHNAWVQHVYMHVIAEINICTTKDLAFFEEMQTDWKKQNRFFEGHNSMHLITLWLNSNNNKFSKEFYLTHIWGEAKDALFEQNNAFLTLFNLELAGFAIPQFLWDDLASHAKQYIEDYFTPYLTITSILSVAKSDIQTAYLGLKSYKDFCKNIEIDNVLKRKAWLDTALPILEGCLAFIEGNFKKAKLLLENHCNHTQPLGHSDEQRAIFSSIYNYCSKLE
jgi:hypothetical protein